MAGSKGRGSNGVAIAGPHSMLGELKRLLKHSAVYGIGNILSKLVGFFLIPVYTRCLSPQDYGMIELLDLTLSFISMIVGMGLSSALLRFYFDTKDKEERNTIVSTALIFISSCAAIVVLLSVIFDHEISLLLFKNNGCELFFDMMIITFFFSGLIEIPLVLLRAQERSVVFSTVTLLRLILALSLNIYFIVIARWGVLGFLVSNLTTSVILSLVLVVTTLSRSQIRFSMRHLKSMVIFGLPLVPSSLGMFWINFGDRFFLKHCYTDWEVGIYSLGYKFAIMISFLIGQPFFLIWSARMYEVIEMKEGERIYARFCTYLATATVFAGLGLSLVIPSVMKIVPSAEYFQAHMVVPIIVLGYVIRELSDFFRGILFITKRTFYVGLTVTVTAGVSTLLYMVLIPAYSMIGAAFATLFTFLFMAGAMLFFAQRQRRIPYEFGRLFALLLVGGALYFALRDLQVENAYLELFVKGALSLLFFPLLYAVGFFRPNEKKKILNILQRSISKMGLGKN
ncbi:MAG: lipopolysaccharide biosynthesis protein [Planctomycetota bacterium]